MEQTQEIAIGNDLPYGETDQRQQTRRHERGRSRELGRPHEQPLQQVQERKGQLIMSLLTVVTVVVYNLSTIQMQLLTLLFLLYPIFHLCHCHAN